MSLGGAGIARHEGLVIFIPFAAPGDTLKVRVLSQKKNFAEAEIVEILTSGPARIQAPCPAYGRCGGCNFQHLNYHEQLTQKQLIVEEQLQKFLKQPVIVQPIVASPKILNYRNRIQVKAQGSSLGFFARGSHEIIDINECLIAEEPLNRSLQAIKKAAPSEKLTKTQISLNQRGEVFTDIELEDDLSEGFAQVNRFQNQNLIKTLLAWTADEQYPEIWDLYSGSGNFTIPLFQAHSRSMVTAVELNQRSVEQGQNRLRELNLSPKKFRIVLNNVSHFLRRHILLADSFILLDPPRAGCEHAAINSLAAQPFKKLIYISCNPSTLGRDLERLFSSSKRKLQLGRVQPFDMFPQTDHVEVMAEILTSR